MDHVAQSFLILTLVAVAGLSFGRFKVRGIGLGSAGVLFAGIAFGHFGAHVDEGVGHFVKEFGLILFVFTMGIQLGPGIVHLWRHQGLKVNAMACGIVLQGAVLVVGLGTLFGFSSLEIAGLFSGATTNTPSLGAAEQSARMLLSKQYDAPTTQPDMQLVSHDKPSTAHPSPRLGSFAPVSLGSAAKPSASEGDQAAQLGSLAAAYAVAYPGGIVGIITAMLVIRRYLKVDIDQEKAQLKSEERKQHEPLQRCCVRVENTRLAEMPFGQILGIDDSGIRISRIQREGQREVRTATEETHLQTGDVAQLVGTKQQLERAIPIIGCKSDVDLMKAAGKVEFQRVYVTESKLLNRPLRELALDRIHGISVTRVFRAGVEMTATGSTHLHYGDVVHIVGEKDSIAAAAKHLGNSQSALNDTPFLPLFAGLGLGVLLGMIPISIPGVPFTFKLGLAGGPLLMAILLSMIGSIGNLVWYIPGAANRALRELGIILFLACAGLAAGDTFVASAMSLKGAAWMFSGVIVTMVPLLTTGFLARYLWGQNYLTLCGVLAGSMTDPPALAFANSFADSEACSKAYAAVYPLTMILRIIAAQAIVVMLV